MNYLLTQFLFTAIALSIFNGPLIKKEVTQYLKKNAPWRVSDYDMNHFRLWSVDDVKLILLREDNSSSKIINLNKNNYKNLYPPNFDYRQKWPNCIQSIRDQGQCGSGWSMALTEFLSDRFCIQGTNVLLSPQDPISCDDLDYGCAGGFIDNSLEYATEIGIVTDSCFPYSSGQSVSPPCIDKCISPEQYIKYKCKPFSTLWLSDENSQKQDLFQNGPIETKFFVYEDFFYYDGGIYTHIYGKLLGGHAVKVIGYGSDHGKYWIAANSWGTKWGENGYFRIAAKQCNFDSQMVSCSPLI